MTRHSVWPAACALTLLAGCSAGTGAPPGPDAAASPTASVSSTGSAGPAGPLQVSRVGSIALPFEQVGPLALSHDIAALPASSSGPDWNQVVTVDVTSAQTRSVADSAWDAGLINWVAVSDGWVAWVDQSSRQRDANPNVLWRVWAQDLSGDHKQLLASNGQTPDPFVPQIHGAEGHFFWTQAEHDRSAREYSWEPGAGAPRTVLRHQEMTPGSETWSDDRIVFLGKAGAPHQGHTVGGDCWSLPATGGEPVALTHTALAMGCAVKDGWLVWSQHIDPNTKNPPPDGILDNPYEMWAQALDGGQPRRLHRGYLSTGYPQAGSGFAAWNANAGRLLLHALDSNAQQVVSPPATLRYVAGDDGLFAFLTGGQGRKPATLHVGKVNRGT
ncbi:hypothetical protein ISU10_21230 [Nocardioides agariphilus]|uniref:WD40-like Beta Propeller Repeat n=1 Tax=Nocardioides agariphilus TaxID=433664 RepID=A0A930VUU0_9ACTN|nr:hypothetical protein [Nocardioides agariphilus]MBF4770305.1 hypothetical protein [Nocardioides agariphilus]